MAALQELSRNLHAAGYDVSPEGGVTYLYASGGALVSKQWNGTSFGDEELINSSARPNSQSIFLVTPEERVVVGISSSNTLSINKFNEDDEEWAEDGSLSTPAVHPDSKLAGYVDTDGSKHVLYQDPSGNLVHLQGSEKSDIIPVKATSGTPLAVVAQETPLIFYVSSQDSFIHQVTRKDGAWADAVVTPFEVKRKLSRLELAPDAETKTLVVYCLADDGTLFQISTEQGGEGEETVLGKVSADGVFKSATSAECCPRVVPCYRPRPSYSSSFSFSFAFSGSFSSSSSYRYC